MKRSRIILVFLILVIIPSVMVILKNKNKTLQGKDTDFAVKDTSCIDKIFIANKHGEKVTLEKKNGLWLVNDKFPARRDNIQLLLETFLKVNVRYPAPASAQEALIKQMAGTAMKCEIYCSGQLYRIWYIGHETQDMKGTNCMLQDPNAEKPFETVYVLEIPGFNGILTPRFYTNEETWREKMVLNLLPTQIKNVTLNAVGQPDSSFSIDVNGLHDFSVKTLSGKNISPFDTLAVQQYLSYFMSLYVDSWIGPGGKSADSARKTNPFLEISVTDIKGKREVFKFLHKPPQEGKEMLEGKKMQYDPELVYVKLHDDKDYANVPVYSWGKLFQPSTYFLPKRVKK